MNVIIIGGAAGSKIAYEIFKLRHDNVVGFHNNYLPDEERKKMTILLNESDVDKHLCGDCEYFVATGDNKMRKEHIEYYTKRYLKKPANAIHPSATISPSATIGRGGLFMPNCVINAGSVVGDGVIINTGAIVEHDNVVGDYAQIAPGATLCGYVVVESMATVNTNASVAPHVKIGKGAVVALNAGVLDDVEPYTMVVGVPAIKKKVIDN